MLASIQTWLHDWAPAADWAVAIGTGLLASFTFYLGKQAKREATAVASDSSAVREQAEAVRDQVELQREMNASASRPYAYAAATPHWSIGGQDPSGTFAWSEFLPVTDGGVGPAANIRGRIDAPPVGGGNAMVELIPTSLPAGQQATVLLSNPLAGPPQTLDGRTGWLTYEDLHGSEWRSTFTFRWMSNRLFIESDAVHERVRGR